MVWLPAAGLSGAAWLPAAAWLSAWHRYDWRVWLSLALGCWHLCSGNILLPTAVLCSTMPLTIAVPLFAAVCLYSAVLCPVDLLWPISALLLAAVQLFAAVLRNRSPALHYTGCRRHVVFGHYAAGILALLELVSAACRRCWCRGNRSALAVVVFLLVPFLYLL
jgi:hypothetical protein